MAVGRKADYTAIIPSIWAKDLFSQAENLTFWHRMEGAPGSSMPILRRDELEKQDGDTIKFDVVLALTGAGLTGDTTLLEGNEEALVFRQTSMTVGVLTHAVRWSKLAAKLITHDMRTTALNQLAKHLAGRIDNALFNELTGQSGFTTMPTKNLWAAGTATTRDTVADTNAGGRLTLATLTELKAYAQVDLKIEPIRMSDGNEFFGIVLHPYTIMQLKEFDTSWAQAQRDAQVRGNDNPLFTGAAGIWDGVIIYSSNRIPRSNNAGPIAVSDNVFFGAQALSRGYGSYPDWIEQAFSYDQESGVAYWCLLGQKLNVFDLNAVAAPGAPLTHTAIGSMVVYASAVAPGQP